MLRVQHHCAHKYFQNFNLLTAELNDMDQTRCPMPEEVRHASRNADSACPFLYWCDGKKGNDESAFRDACRTSSGPMLLLPIVRLHLKKKISFDCMFR